MPLHDWSRVPRWPLFTIFISTGRSRSGRDPEPRSSAQGDRRRWVEQRYGPRESDVLAIESRGKGRSEFSDDAGVATMIPAGYSVCRAGRAKQIYATRLTLWCSSTIWAEPSP